MRKLTSFSLVFLLSLGFLNSAAALATFYGEIPTGYQFVEKRGSGYGVYVPKSFISNSRRNTLIFAFGRTPNDLSLTKDQLEDYAKIWWEVAERQGAVVVVPYWEPVVVEGNQRTEKFFLDILEEVQMIYSIDSEKILIAGFGLGAAEAFSLAALYPDRFQAVAAIASSPLRDRIMNSLMDARLMGKKLFHKMPPVLILYGENDTTLTLERLKEDKSALEKLGARVEIKQIANRGNRHDPQVNPFILDWFETVSAKVS